MAFDNIFSNALCGGLGAAAGGADFDPRNKSEAEIMRFCQSYMTALVANVGVGVIPPPPVRHPRLLSPSFSAALAMPDTIVAGAGGYYICCVAVPVVCAIGCVDVLVGVNLCVTYLREFSVAHCVFRVACCALRNFSCMFVVQRPEHRYAWRRHRCWREGGGVPIRPGITF